MTFLPAIASPFRLTVGLHRIDPAGWIVADDGYPADLVERERVLAAHRADVVQCLADANTAGACRELLGVLAAALPDDERVWHRDASGGLEVVPTGWRLDADVAPLEAIAHLVADDLCVLNGETFVLVAGVVCFPNRWRLADKLGRHITDVHGPVPGYESELGGKVTQLLAKLRAGTVLERRNWSLLDDPALYQPDEPLEITPLDGDHDAADRLWARVERQTLRRLPLSGAIVFSIRTFQRPLRDVGGPDRADLARALRELPDDMTAYKSIGPLRAAACAYLEREGY